MLKNINLMRVCFLAFSTMFILCGLQSCAQKIVGCSDNHISYMGRIGGLDNGRQLYWSGSSITLNFNGTDVSALLGDEFGFSFLNVIVDGTDISKLQLSAGKKVYKLALNLQPGNHSIELFKRTEYAEGTATFYNFQLNNTATLLPPLPAKKRKIEFYGNSITSGYAIEDFEGGNNSYLPQYKNNYLSYAALTARHFDAQYHCISKSGIGMVLSGFNYTMPDIYNLLNPNDPASLWDFSKYTPDVVVVNLFQNDAYYLTHPEGASYKAKFGNTPPTPNYIIKAYQAFIQTLRGKYPKAAIICVLGSMDAVRDDLPWKGYIEKAVAGMNDPKVFTHFFALQTARSHPSLKQQQIMADDLISFIDQNVKW